MSSGIVLSIHSVHARNIYKGVKRYEYRTRKPKRDVDYIALYETGATQAITGIAKIAGILEDTPSMIWSLTKSFSGISRDYFKSYFCGKKKAVAYCISEVVPFESPITLSEIGIEHTPQSFQYINENEVSKLLELEIDNKKPLLPRFFFGGVHGVEKSTFVRKVATEMGLPFYSASNVVSHGAKLGTSKQVSTSGVSSDQSPLLAGLHKTTDWFNSGGLLDGHFVLKAGDELVSPIPTDVFSQLNLDAMFVLTEKPSNIAERLRARDGDLWNESAIEKIQQEETARAKVIAKQLSIPLSIIR